MISLAIVGVIAEFNPLHSGHQRLLRQIRSDGAEAVVCVLSGNFVQRGDAAILPVAYRAEAALRCGADLCLLLPLPWAMSTAQNFADGAVGLLQDTAVVDTIAFGSESGEIDALSACAEWLDAPALREACRPYLRQGLSFAAARAAALRACAGEAVASLLDTPNNTLGISYLCAMRKFGFAAAARTYPRVGAAHDAQTPAPDGASASYLRELILAGKVDACADFMPEAAFSVLKQAERAGRIADPARIAPAVLSKLRSLPRDALSTLPDLSEGLENRLYAAISTAGSLDALFAQVKAKRYSHARIRRLIYSAFFGIDRRFFCRRVPYLRVLGFTERGEALLRRIGRESKLPVLTRKRDAEKLDADAQFLYTLEADAADQYALALRNPLPRGAEYQHRPIRVFDESEAEID